MSQYFENDETVVSAPVTVRCWAGPRELSFLTDNGVFSRGEIDEASFLLVKQLPPLEGRVLDLGCGYGFIGQWLKALHPELEILQSDVNRRALELCRRNRDANGLETEILESDGFAALEGDFDAVVLNPPIHAGKEVCYRLYSEAKDRLKENGRLFLVIRKKHGAESTLRHLREEGWKVEELYGKKGLYVYACS
jgi:16S rRNA (guanine1207-N2)-methyltransferase